MPLSAADGNWTYAEDPTESDVDQVRFVVQDVDPSLPLLMDLELQWLIDKWMPKYDSLTYVAAIAAAIISRKFIGVLSITADGVSVSTSDLATRYAEMATRLRAEAKEEGLTGGVLDLTNLMWDSELDYGIKALSFGQGQFDNPGAGRQDYGGTSTRPHNEDWVGW